MNGSDRKFDHLSRFWMNRIPIFVWLLIAVQTPILHAQDPYLEALQNEAEALSVDSVSNRSQQPRRAKNSSSSPPAWSANSQAPQSELPPKLSKKGFERALKGRFYGTFMFYRQLTGSQQKSVYAVYQRNPNVEVVREKVVNLLKEQ